LSTTRRPISTSAPSSSGAEVVYLPTAESTTSESTTPTDAEVAEARARAESRNLEGWVNWLARPEKKVAIIGFTMSRDEAPWNQPGWEIWVCNNLALHLRPEQKFDRIYDLHDYGTISSDKPHEAYLRTTDKPVVVWNPRPEWPSSVPFPKDQITEAFGRYFSNSISWMIAHAIFEGATDIHVYGVDMAQGTEYAAQRPSCEYFLGLAAGRGINVHIPQTSDLLKVAAMYGVEDDSALRIKLETRERELNERAALLNQQAQQVRDHQNQVAGALENTRYFRSVCLNPAANRDGSRKVSSEEAKPAEAPANA